MGFAANIRRIRATRGWTQTEAAAALDVPFRTYQNWEAGSREPKLSALPDIAAAFGASVVDLIAEPDSPASDTRPSGKRK